MDIYIRVTFSVAITFQQTENDFTFSFGNVTNCPTMTKYCIFYLFIGFYFIGKVSTVDCSPSVETGLPVT
jgi:hypothetical protein